ncbi:MAG: CDP-diacylglycerol--glycerol-3-phosphate 3-phosphatidyltransferase, partial [Candidatus Dormibacteraeota bacterium]|nr:CDP-diacylglycerol--glycerol-3-phosphate 3-phosphatidyltransferase [Candidatus Dormibacteraeota bacterium]
MNLPNSLTVARLVSVPVLMVLILVEFPYHDQIAAAVFLLASLTDTLDGNLARARGQVTELGKFLDPLADKLFILSVLIVLVQVRQLAAWVVVVIFGRELLITVLRSLSATQGRVIAATPWGKTKTVSQVLAVLLLILQQPYPRLQIWATVVVGFAVAFTVLSGADYLWRFRHVVLLRGDPERQELSAGADAGSGSDPPAD